VVIATPEAATFVVSPIPGVGDYTTIQEAIDNLPPEGGYILVREGDYTITTPIVLPNKPLKLVGCGNSGGNSPVGTTLTIGAGLGISVFYDNFDQDRTMADFCVQGDGTAGQVFYEGGPGTTFNSDGTSIANVDVLNVQVFAKSDPTNGYLGLITYNVLWTGPANDPNSWIGLGNGSFTAIQGFFADVNFGGSSGGFGRNGGATGWDVFSVRSTIAVANGAFLQATGGGLQATESTFLGNDSVDALITLSSGSSDKITGCYFVACRLETRFTSIFTGCQFVNSSQRMIDVVSGNVVVSGCWFAGGGTPEAIRIAGGTGKCVITGNFGCKVVELNANCQNLYSNNSGFDGSTILGTLSMVNNENVQTTTGNPTLDDSYRTLLVNASGGTKTVNLPTAASARYRKYTILKSDSSGNAVTIDASGGETINGALTKVLAAQYDKVTIQSDGTAWFIVG
jgi:hypothetical protein